MFHFIEQAARDFVAANISKTVGDGIPFDPDRSLDAAIIYLMRTIDACGGNASSKGYKVLSGWMPPYPETSGYIIPTLYQVGLHKSDQAYADTAEKIGYWLLSIQRKDGGFVGREYGKLSRPIVFNTGMILIGLNRLFAETRQESFAIACDRAAEFLVRSADESGCFVRHLSNDIIHTYNVRAAWGLYQRGVTASDSRFIDVARKNADWTLTQQLPNGFFNNNRFKPGGPANSHGLAYIIRGLYEIHKLSADPRYLDAVRLTADQICDLYEKNGWLAATFDEDWQYTAKFTCLTGCAQLAIVLLKLCDEQPNSRYEAIAEQLIKDVARTQYLDNTNVRHFGAIKGSQPIYGGYAPLQYPNWATKFFIDALLKLKKQQAKSAELQLGTAA